MDVVGTQYNVLYAEINRITYPHWTGKKEQ